MKDKKKSHYRQEIWDKSDGHCWYCGIAMKPFTEFSVDHFVPSSLGGDDNIENLVPCCRRCNCKKKDRDIEELRGILAIGHVHFSPQQVKLLESLGYTDFTERAGEKTVQYEFWFEKNGKEIV